MQHTKTLENVITSAFEQLGRQCTGWWNGEYHYVQTAVIGSTCSERMDTRRSIADTVGKFINDNHIGLRFKFDSRRQKCVLALEMSCQSQPRKKHILNVFYT